ncbi:MAG TPA: ABC transporter substrate-binding protein [Stellaceae bacterium]|nr:ABC transporter substrate-binding protein [Stellaceae bacterium]
MKRRSIIAGIAAAPLLLATPSLAQTRTRIGILHSGYPNRTPIDRLFEALAKLGYENGRTASIELLGAEGDSERLKALVAHLVGEPPDVIIAMTSPAVLALKQAKVATPVVFVFVPDPVGLGVVESLAHPGGTFTGVTFSEALLGGKRLDLLSEALPAARRVAVIWSPSFVENAAILDTIQSSASTRGIEIYSRTLRGLEDLAPAFDDAQSAGAQALIFMTDNLIFGHRKEVAELALRHHLPSIHSYPPEAREGGLMSFGPELEESYQRTAALTDRVLKGARPSDLPVEEPTRFTFLINLNTATALGITISQSLLARADEVIE